jgi:hypothetical protein
MVRGYPTGELPTPNQRNCKMTTDWTQEEEEVMQNMIAQSTNALDVQVDGNHYKDQAIQPVEYIHANGIGYMEGNVIKYVSRWRKKNGIKDLEKAKHYIELLIELENRKCSAT